MQFIRGLQGDDPKYFKTVATVKHFAVHSGPEPERHTFDAVVSERDLRETTCRTSRWAFAKAGAYSLMCAYNRVDGKAACGSDMLLKDILRGEWKFPGYIVSDCGAIDDIYLRHKVVPTAAEAAALAVKTGTDLDCGRVYPNLVDAVKQGLITEAQIDISVTRLFLAALQARHVRPAGRACVGADSVQRRRPAGAPGARATGRARVDRAAQERSGNVLPLSQERSARSP